MFKIAFLIGIYSYLIFALGLLGLLYKNNIVFLTIFYIAVVFAYYKKIILTFLKDDPFNKVHPFIKDHPFISAFIALQLAINLIGALGPELSFDALWYHLTLPKLYLENHKVGFIPGGLFYYSSMPQLTEMLYAASLAFAGETLAKIVHFSFGTLSLIALYFLSRKFFSTKLSLICILIFYSNLVVAWESTTAYIDLARTFFEIMCLFGFVNFIQTKQKKWLIKSAVLLGLAVSSKLLAFGSLAIITLVIIAIFIYQKNTFFKNFISVITNILAFWFFCLLTVLPWLIFSYVNTGNPIYPFFSNVYKVNFDFNLLNPFRFVTDFWEIFTHSADPLSPIYIIVLPLMLIYFRKVNKSLFPIVLYSFLAVLIWHITPKTGGGRFILPYLPAFSMLVVEIIRIFKNYKFVYKILIFAVFFIAFSTVIYRVAANLKYVPVILGKETKSEFLSRNLNFSFGDFYDIDGFFSQIPKHKKALLYGFHNLYYANFLFIDSSFVKKGDKFFYVAVQNSKLPERFKHLNLIYKNKITQVEVYSLSSQEIEY